MNDMRQFRQQGLTLLELSVVLLVLMGLAGLLIPFLGGTTDFARCTTTQASMVAIRDALLGSFEKPGYREDMNALPVDIRGLLLQNYCLEDATLLTQATCTGAGKTWITQAAFNPVTRRGWRGPYLLQPMLDDGYLQGNAIILQIPSVDGDGNDCVTINAAYGQNDCARLVSNGPDGNPDTTLADANGSARKDDRILYLFIPDPNPSPACNARS